MASISNNSNEAKELFVLAIELGNQNIKYLKIYPDTDPDKLSYDFCAQNNLDYGSMQNLSLQIKNALNDAKKVLKNSSQNSGQDSQITKGKNTNDLSSKEIQTPKYNFKDITTAINSTKNVNLNFKIFNFCNKACQNFPKDKSNIKNNENKKNNDNFGIEQKKKNIKSEKNNYMSQTISSQSKSLKKQKSYDKIYNSKTISLNNGYIGLREKIFSTRSYKQNINNKDKNKIENDKEDKKEKINENKDNSENKENININDNKENTINNDDKSEDIKDEKNNSSIEEINDNENNNKKEKKSSQELNYCKRLYQKGLKMKENACEKVKSELAKELIKEKKECTFKPKINHTPSEDIYQSNKKNNNLYHKKENQNILIDYEKENTFAPKINPNSIKILKNSMNSNAKNRGNKGFERLYNQKKDFKNLEKKIYNLDILFKPKTNTDYKGAYNNLPFEQRQKIYKAKSTERKKKINNQVNIDKNTGQKFFQPKINKNYPSTDRKNQKRNNSARNNANNLFLDAQRYRIKNNDLQKKLIAMENNNKNFKASEKSHFIFNNQIYNSFKKIFKLLDKDEDNKISRFNYNIKSIPQNIQKIISPLLKELDEENENLNCDEFIFVCEKLYAMLDYFQKKDIYNFGSLKKKITQRTITFSNEMDDNKTKNTFPSFENFSAINNNEVNRVTTSSMSKLKTSNFNSNNDKCNCRCGNCFICLNKGNYKTYCGSVDNNTEVKAFNNLIIQRDHDEIIDKKFDDK